MLQPFYSTPSEEEIIVHFSKVNELDIPIAIYNNPYVTKKAIPNPLLKSLFNNNENIKAVKDSTGDIRSARNLIHELNNRIDLLCGWEDMALEYSSIGPSGWTSLAEYHS